MENEFSTDPMLQPSIDVMYYNYLKYYNKTICPCGAEFWQKKALEQRTLCGVCTKRGKQ